MCELVNMAPTYGFSHIFVSPEFQTELAVISYLGFSVDINILSQFFPNMRDHTYIFNIKISVLKCLHIRYSSIAAIMKVLYFLQRRITEGKIVRGKKNLEKISNLFNR